jgi:hypothetical protein
MSDDPKLSQRYRELPREEPPRHLDDAILAASRRAGASRPAPLVAPTGRRRWYFPVAAAAIIVLAVAVTVHVERQQHDLEVAEAPVAPAPPFEEQPQAQAPAREQALAREPASKREAFTPDPKPAPSEKKSAPRHDARLSDLYKAPAPPEPASPPAAAPTPPPVEAQARGRAEARSAMGEGRAATDSIAASAARSPEQWLQGIAELRRQGRHDEADRQLAEFRRAFPNYRISEAMLEKVEKR